jgi:hypothetical protein
MTSFIVDKDGNQIDASTVTSKPSDRHFRNAWAISGKVIAEDMTKAKEIFKDKLKAAWDTSVLGDSPYA